MLDAVSVAMVAIMAPRPARPCCSVRSSRERGFPAVTPPAPPARPSAAVLRDRVERPAVADVEMVVVAGEPRRQALADQHRIVEVDELDVAGRGGADEVDERARRGPVIGREPPVRPPRALVLVVADRADVDVEAALVGLVAGDVPAVLEAAVADRDPALGSRGECRGCRLQLADRGAGRPVRLAVAHAVVTEVPGLAERRVVVVPDEVSPRGRA